MNDARSDAFVFFGATGDLAFKQIFPALQALMKNGRLNMPIVAVGRKALPIEKMRERVKESLEKSGSFDAAAFEKLSKQLKYAAVDYDDPASFRSIKEAIGGAKHPLFYVALPPEVFESVASNAKQEGMADGARLVVEKPFGHDTKSARELSEDLYKSFPEGSIFRIDHFLGKETVENIVYFRAANPVIESSLNAGGVDSVQITMAETFGVKGRAKFYDSVGAIRDVVQNHMLEVLACLAMELPKSTDANADGLRDERSKLLAKVKTLDPKDVVRGQVKDFVKEEGVAKDSKTETFAILKLGIDLPRWKDVPFYVRVGKSLPVTATEIFVRFKPASAAVLDDKAPPPPNHLRLRIGPDGQIAFGTNVKKNGEELVGESKELLLCRSQADAMKAYERLLGDAIDGNPMLFARRDAVEESWRVVEPILNDKVAVHTYDEGTWGPEEASAIVPPGGWWDPKVEAPAKKS